MSRITVAGITAGLIGFSSLASGQAVSPVEAGDRLDRVVILGHYDTDIGTSTAASQGVVDGEALQDIPVQRPGQVLETVPGLVVTQHSGDGKANQYFLRGYNLDHGTDLATYVDGVPVNMPTNAHGQGYSDLNFLIPELVDRIDYQKGPYYSQYGDFASAGAVDVHYLNALEHGFANMTAGDAGYRRIVLAGSCTNSLGGCVASGDSSLSIDLGGVRVLGAVELLEENGPWSLPEHLHKFNALLKLSNGSADRGWSLDAVAYAAHWDSTDQVPLALIDSGQLGLFSALDPSDGGDSDRDLVSGEWHSSSSDGYTKASLYAEHYRLQLWSDFTFFELRPTTGDQFEQLENRNLAGGQLVQGWIADPFGIRSVTEAGVQFRHDNIDVGLFDTEQRHVFATVSNEIIGETEAGAYLQNTLRFTPWFQSRFGLREDVVAADADALSESANSGNAYASKLSPKMALVFGPWANTEFFVDAGKGFHSNDARGVIDRLDPTTGLPSSPVPALVGSLGKELGARTTIIPGLQSSLALWTLDSASELIYNADSDIGSTSPNAASKRRGVEWNNHAVLGTHLLLDLDLAWTHARYVQDNQNEESGDYIPNAVSKVGVFRATIQDFGPWTVGVETRYIGPYPLSQNGSLTNSSSTVTNLRFRYVLTRNTSLILDGLNIFNKQYYDIAYEQDYRVNPTAPIVPDGITVHPGEPREFRVTLNTLL